LVKKKNEILHFQIGVKVVRFCELDRNLKKITKEKKGDRIVLPIRWVALQWDNLYKLVCE
jgi:hypothetical protein